MRVASIQTTSLSVRVLLSYWSLNAPIDVYVATTLHRATYLFRVPYSAQRYVQKPPLLNLMLRLNDSWRPLLWLWWSMANCSQLIQEQSTCSSAILAKKGNRHAKSSLKSEESKIRTAEDKEHERSKQCIDRWLWYVNCKFENTRRQRWRRHGWAGSTDRKSWLTI